MSPTASQSGGLGYLGVMRFRISGIHETPVRDGSSASHARTWETISRYRCCFRGSDQTSDGSRSVHESM